MTTSNHLLADLPRPVPDVLPDDPQWDEQGLMRASQPLVPLKVVVPAWAHNPIPGSKTILILYWTTGATDHQVGYGEWDDDDYPPGELPEAERTFDVPLARLVEGLHNVWYSLNDPQGMLYDSDKAPVTIDLTPPALGTDSGRLIFDTDTIDEQYLIDHGDQVLASVPVYTEFKPGDVITWYWSSAASDPVAADEVGSLPLPRGTSQPLTLVYSGDTIRDRLDGQRFARYRLTDRAGNQSPYSAPFELTVDVQPVERQLPSPTVAEANGSPISSTLDLNSARGGATVVIPDDAELDPGDVLEVQWAAPGSYGAYVATVPDATGKRFAVPAQYIAQHMGTSIEVYYRVTNVSPRLESERHTLTVPEKTSGWTTIQCTNPRVDLGKLSLANVVDSATFYLIQWMFIAIDQRVTVTLGTGASTKVVLDKYSVTQADIDVVKGVSVDVPKSVLRSLPLGPMPVSVKVSFDGGKTEIPFPTLSLTLTS